MIHTFQQAIRAVSLLCFAAILIADSLRFGGICLQSFQLALVVSSFILPLAFLNARRYRIAALAFTALAAISAISLLPRPPAWAQWVETVSAAAMYVTMYCLALSLPRKNQVPSRTAIVQTELGRMVVDAFEKDELYLDPYLSFEKLRAELGTNRTYLSKAINDSYGKNFKTVLATYRVKRARTLLEQDPSMKIMDLYSMCGFRTQASLDIWFKTIYGETPQEYALEVQARAISRKDPSNSGEREQ